MSNNASSTRLAFAIETAVSSPHRPRMFREFKLQRASASVVGDADACTLLVKDDQGQIFLVRVNRYA